MPTNPILRQMQWSRGSPVVVVKPSERGRGDDGLCDIDGDRWLPRNPLADSLMGSCLVEVRLVLGDKPTKMLVIKDDHVVEDLSPCVADKSLSDGVHVGGSRGDLDHPDSYALGYMVERRPELVVAITGRKVSRPGPRRGIRLKKVRRCIATDVVGGLGGSGSVYCHWHAPWLPVAFGTQVTEFKSRQPSRQVSNGQPAVRQAA